MLKALHGAGLELILDLLFRPYEIGSQLHQFQAEMV